jgi:predicted acylesterase/phospholipase RssA
MSNFIERARNIASGDVAPPLGEELKALIRELKSDFEFKLSREILRRARDVESDRLQAVWIVQQIALCTYKDEDLLPSTRFREALALLDEVGLKSPDKAAPGTLPETLGLAGAVYKRRWESEGRLEDLYQAHDHYLAAWKTDPKLDLGWGGVNAAYILDVLAARWRTLSKRGGVDPKESTHEAKAAELDRQAADLRATLMTTLSAFAKDDPRLEEKRWYCVTMAEIAFGLEVWSDAGRWLARAGALRPLPSEWEVQTTAKQLIALARLRRIVPPEEDADEATWHPAWKALKELLGPATAPAISNYRGKVGLALSGGGFRASMFHIGVLARLAETGVLRTVEVLSTVSGGSIVGAHYYLELAHLLRSKDDVALQRQDYVDAITRVLRDFKSGVELNLRTRVLSNLVANIRMIVTNTYSRSHRIGELYERKLYAKVEDGHPAEEPRKMSGLLIEPHGWSEPRPFKPKFHNWRRRAKVPALLLNATSLNSGHVWQFTARSMGEPPGLVGPEVDVNPRYRRLWYDDAPTNDLKTYRLGHAVAASACVPGLFDPLSLKGLYPGRVVRLVDGGVHDNQGVAGLLNEGCNLVLVSDASGQMADMEKPSDGALGVPLRANSVLQSRVREAQYQDVRARLDSRSLQGLCFIHLKKGLEVLPLDWIDCNDKTKPPRQSISTTDYGVDKDMQRKLSAIRTDLDSFSELEAYSLMASGYLMVEAELKRLDARHQADKEPGSWGDFDVHADAADVRRRELGLHLEAASSLAFKIWMISPFLRTAARVGGLGVLVLGGWLLRTYWGVTVSVPGLSLSFNGLVISAALGAVALVVPVVKWLRPQQASRSLIAKTLLAIVGFFFSNLHLRTFDWAFKSRGRLQRLLKLQ